jgi:predicted ester cyclase
MTQVFSAVEERKTDNIEIIRGVYRDITSRRTTGIPPCLATLDNFFSLVSKALPDYKLTVHSLLPKGDMVMARYSITGTQKSNFMGIEATQGRMTISGIDVFQLENGEVVAYRDTAHQIGAF